MSDETEDAPSSEGLAKHTKLILPVLMASIVIPFVALALEPTPTAREIEPELAAIDIADGGQNDVSEVDERTEEADQIEAIAEVVNLSPDQVRQLLAAPPEEFEQMYREMTAPAEIYDPIDREMQMGQRHAVELNEMICQETGQNCAVAEMARRHYNKRYGGF